MRRYVDALRLGAYQLLYLERVPVSAAVNDSVELVKRRGVASAAAFVNAVLRRLARERGRADVAVAPDAAIGDDRRALASIWPSSARIRSGWSSAGSRATACDCDERWLRLQQSAGRR